MTRPPSFLASALLSATLVAGLAAPGFAANSPFNALQTRVPRPGAMQGPAASSPSWTFTSVLVPNAATTYVFGFGPDSSYVGAFIDSSGNEHGFLERNNGKIVQFDVRGALGTSIVAANALYHVVQAQYAKGVTKSYLVDARGRSTPIAVPGAKNTSAWAINASGTIVVGSYVSATNPNLTAAFMCENGKYATFAMKNASLTAYYGINASGVISGTYYEKSGHYQSTGFTIDNGKMKTIQYPGVTSTVVQGINDSGEVVGYVRDLLNVSNTGFVYNGKTFTNVGVGVPDYVWAWAIDNAGDVAGFDVPQYESVGGFVGTIEK